MILLTVSLVSLWLVVGFLQEYDDRKSDQIWIDRRDDPDWK